MRAIGCIFKALSTFILLAAILILLVLTVILHACSYQGYNGEYADLYTVAVNNIFGIYGHRSNGEVLYDPSIEIIETDEYGRTLFFYNEAYGSGASYGMAFVIMQSSDNKYVYYYQDDCYEPFFDNTEDEKYFGGEDDTARAIERIGDDVIEALKERNDWNRELNEEKYTRTRISDSKSDGEIRVTKNDFDNSIYSYAKANGYSGDDRGTCRIIKYCNADTAGQELYYVYSVSSDTDDSGETVYGYYEYAVIVAPDGSISQNAITEIKSPSDSYALIKELKAQNNWS